MSIDGSKAQDQLRAIALVCTLKPSPGPSSSELIAEHVFEKLRAAGVGCESVRLLAVQAGTQWNGEAMQTTDYLELDKVPDAVASETAAAARNAVHLAHALSDGAYPPYE